MGNDSVTQSATAWFPHSRRDPSPFTTRDRTRGTQRVRNLGACFNGRGIEVDTAERQSSLTLGATFEGDDDRQIGLFGASSGTIEPMKKRLSKAVTKVLKEVKAALEDFGDLSVEDQISLSNEIKTLLHEAGPFANEPVDLVRWEKSDGVVANDYNPNAVAPPEMKLLEISIAADGYTQPIVTDRDEEIGKLVVVDGFHRNRVGRESEEICKRVRGYLPVVQIRTQQKDRPDRIASTIRHNRARGKHRVDAMSNIVLELKRRNWSDEKVGRELGMDPDEVLRLAQISGLAEAFKDRDFSKAWETDYREDDAAVETIIAEDLLDE